MACSWPYNTLGCASGAGRIQNVGWMITRHSHTRCWPSARLQCMPFYIYGTNFSFALFSLKDNSKIWLVLSQINRGIQKRFICYNSAWLDPARSCYDCFGCRIIDPNSQLIGRKSAKYNRVDSANTYAR